jgi:hypothetical protein
MDLFGGVIAAMVATGCILVVGGLYLIASGALKLAGDKDGSTNFKFGDLLQVGTTVPGLGIFLIGMLFELAGLYYANQARVDSDQLNTRIAAALSEEQQHHALKLTGMIKTATGLPVSVQICMGNQIYVPSNMGFQQTLGPYLDFVTATLQTAGSPPVSYIISGSTLPPSFKTYARVVQPKDGIFDLGNIELNQAIDLTPAITANKILPAKLDAVPAAGQAYGAGS